MTIGRKLLAPGVVAALTAAALFGASTPLAKLFLAQMSPWMLAGLFYFGSGIGLALFRLLGRSKRAALPPNEWRILLAAIGCGGVIAPVLLMFGLTNMPASSASLLLNAEGVCTALLAWFVFRENFDRRIAIGMLMIVIGGLILSWPGAARLASMWPSLAVLGACLAWGMDNNLTRKVSLSDATWIASMKGLVAGGVNLLLAFSLGAALPPLAVTLMAMLVGFLSYGVSLTLFVVGLRHLGTARTGAYFSIAPFFGTVLAIWLLHEPITLQLCLAGLLMAGGIWLHLTERHAHAHHHQLMEHTHEHEHDEHHQHQHEPPVVGKHSHHHRHDPITHAHPHFPDAHHQHQH